MLMIVNWCLMGVIIFMVAGLYGKLEQIQRTVAALRKAVAEPASESPAAAAIEPPPAG